MGNNFGGHCKLKEPGMLSWEKKNDKPLLPVKCAVCGIDGMAYSDPFADPRPHYCFQHLKGDNS